jgi:MFS family permease
MWVGQLVSTAGSALTSLAAGIYVYRQTGSAMSVAFMMMATAMPTLLVGLLAGVIVDRYDRKKIMVVSEYLRAALIFTIPFLVAQDILWLYIIVALTSAVGQFFDPAHESVLPEVASMNSWRLQFAARHRSFGSTAIGSPLPASSPPLCPLNGLFTWMRCRLSFPGRVSCSSGSARPKPKEKPM